MLVFGLLNNHMPWLVPLQFNFLQQSRGEIKIKGLHNGVQKKIYSQVYS